MLILLSPCQHHIWYRTENENERIISAFVIRCLQLLRFFTRVAWVLGVTTKKSDYIFIVQFWPSSAVDLGAYGEVEHLWLLRREDRERDKTRTALQYIIMCALHATIRIVGGHPVFDLARNRWPVGWSPPSKHIYTNNKVHLKITFPWYKKSFYYKKYLLKINWGIGKRLSWIL